MNQKLLHKHFYYEDGFLKWKLPTNQSISIGSIAGSKNKKTGYWSVGLCGRPYVLHRVIYMYHHGDIDDGLVIDHIDRNKDNNKIGNLRCVTTQVNNFNVDRNGVRRLPSGRFQARIKTDGKLESIGTYDSFDEARRVYILEKKLRHNIHNLD